MVQGSITKAYERQIFFLKIIVQDYTSDILYLDLISKGSSLPTLWQILIAIKSTNLLNLSLF